MVCVPGASETVSPATTADPSTLRIGDWGELVRNVTGNVVGTKVAFRSPAAENVTVEFAEFADPTVTSPERLQLEKVKPGEASAAIR